MTNFPCSLPSGVSVSLLPSVSSTLLVSHSFLLAVPSVLVLHYLSHFTLPASLPLSLSLSKGRPDAAVQKFHESQNVVDGSKHPVKKFDHLVFGPAAGRDFPGRVQCDGFKAISKVPSLHSPRFLKFQESISIVTFFVAYNDTLLRKNKPEKFSEKVTVGNTSYDKAGKSLAILNVFINFIQVSMPQSNVIILTDPASDLSYSRNNVSVFPIHGNYSRENLMLQRIKAYITWQLLMTLDVYLRTIHNFILLSLSGTIKISLSIQEAKTFLEEVLRIYVSKFSKASYMLGDQLSLAWVVRDHAAFNSKRFTKSEAFVDEINGAFVLFLPCLVYNWTPPEGAGQFHGMPVDVKVRSAFFDTHTTFHVLHDYLISLLIQIPA
ncbi:hypothetical protein EJ110_NYTH33909 [Nymphaea thermarum]|nr:hypothetical protein EJ110_NYTH33909 [Nymphaea thermarum]